MNMKPNKPKLTALGRLPPTPPRNPVLTPQQAGSVKPKLTALGRLPPTSIAMSAQVKPPVNLRGLGRAELQAPKPSLQGLGKVIPHDGTPSQPQEQAFYQEQGGGYYEEGSNVRQLQPQQSQQRNPSDDERLEESLSAPPEVSEEEQSDFAQSKFARDWESDVPWQEMQGFAGEQGYREDKAPKVFAEVINGRLCTTAICPSDFGLIPVTDVRYVDEDLPNGPVFGLDDVPEMLREPLKQGIKAVKMQSKEKALELAIEGLVVRSRQGDQNAMGMIVAIREQADKGSARAKKSVAMLQRYIDEHPVVDGAFGADDGKSDVLFSAAIALANGAPLSENRIRQIASTFGAEAEKEQKLFLYGVANFKKEGVLAELAKRFGEYAKQVLDLGKGVGQARAIQLVRLPNTPISPYSADAGWEHGE